MQYSELEHKNIDDLRQLAAQVELKDVDGLNRQELIFKLMQVSPARAAAIAATNGAAATATDSPAAAKTATTATATSGRAARAPRAPRATTRRPRGAAAVDEPESAGDDAVQTHVVMAEIAEAENAGADRLDTAETGAANQAAPVAAPVAAPLTESASAANTSDANATTETITLPESRNGRDGRDVRDARDSRAGRDGRDRFEPREGRGG
ncbi:MAG TPA: Rho termination factor N-terminal domain-containing protein, partial [Chloroflexota bacterium]|nr:Rho termination factor N-terminal domain-containing protein [Chloroflexota bacterium]